MAKGTIGGPGVMDFYTGPLAPRYTRIADYTGGTTGGNPLHESAQNQWQQQALNNLLKFAKDSGLGKYSASQGSETGWMPTANEPNEQRLAANKWQFGQIADLEKWASSLATTHAGRDWAKPYKSVAEYTGSERHAHNQNVWQQSAIANLQNYLTDLEVTRGGGPGGFGLDDIATNKRKQYEDYINEAYKNILGRKDGADAAGLKYWADTLLGLDGKSAAGLNPGDSWKTWIDDQLKGSSEYKDIQAGTGPDPINLDDYISKDELADLIKTAKSDVTSTLTSQFQSDLAAEKSKWDADWGQTVQGIKDQFGTQIDTLKTGWEGTSQAYKQNIADLKSVIASQQQAVAAYGDTDRPMNQTVKGVKTKNELPGYQPKFKTKSDWFGRKGSRIGTSSLNI